MVEILNHGHLILPMGPGQIRFNTCSTLHPQFFLQIMFCRDDREIHESSNSNLSLQSLKYDLYHQLKDCFYLDSVLTSFHVWLTPVCVVELLLMVRSDLNQWRLNMSVLLSSHCLSLTQCWQPVFTQTWDKNLLSKNISNNSLKSNLPSLQNLMD